jgi:hypothetical protein
MNKYANNYLNSLVEAIKSYRPGNLGDAITTGVPLFGGLGALTGATVGAIKDPGVDESGKRKSKVMQIINSAAGGGLLGAGAAVATPIALPALFSGLATIPPGLFDAARRSIPAKEYGGELLKKFETSTAAAADRAYYGLAANMANSSLPYASLKDLFTNRN